MAKGGNKNFRLLDHVHSRPNKPRYHVHLASNGQHVATVNGDGQDGFRFVLDNYPHHHSKQYGTLKACLTALEGEVL